MSVRSEITAMASSEAVFGSASRGDVDAMSDRDILIVDDDVAVLRERTRILKSEGWSVASYTFAKLEALAGRGALFVQHLKLEAAVLRDRNGRLRRLLEGFQPLGDYTAEIHDNERLARLAGTAPSGPRGALLCADVLYVAVRNYGILSLAERGIHTYSYTSVIAALETEGMISAGGAKALSGLRFLKCLYRAGERERVPRARGAVDRALMVLPKTRFPRKLHVVDPRAILCVPARGKAANSYLELRELERRLVALETLMPHAVKAGDLAQLSRWVANPRAYASISRRLAPRMRTAISVWVDRIGAGELLRAAVN